MLDIPGLELEAPSEFPVPYIPTLTHDGPYTSAAISADEKAHLTGTVAVRSMWTDTGIVP
jgi:hypothetical protein